MKKLVYISLFIFLMIVSIPNVLADTFDVKSTYTIDGKQFTLMLSDWQKGTFYEGDAYLNLAGASYKIINAKASGAAYYFSDDEDLNVSLKEVLAANADQIKQDDIYSSGMALAPEFIYVKDKNNNYYFMAVNKGTASKYLNDAEVMENVEYEFSRNGASLEGSTFNKVNATSGIVYGNDKESYESANEQMANKNDELVEQYKKECEGKTLSGEAKYKCESIIKQIEQLGLDISYLEDSTISNEETTSNKDLQDKVKETLQTQQVTQNAMISNKKGTELASFNFSLKVGCDTVFGGENGEIGEWLKNVFRFLQFVGLALVIVLSSLDFIKVISGHKDDELKNAFSRTTKRFIAAALLFLAPVLVQFALDIAGSDLFTGDGKPLSICIDFYK